MRLISPVLVGLWSMMVGHATSFTGASLERFCLQFEELAARIEATRTVQETTGMKDLIRLELELACTFVDIARTKYSMGRIAGGDTSHGNAIKAYRTALRYLGK